MFSICEIAALFIENRHLDRVEHIKPYKLADLKVKINAEKI